MIATDVPAEDWLMSGTVDDWMPEWDQLALIATAAAAGDATAFHVGLVDLNVKFPGGARAKALAGFALRYQLIRRYGRLPTASQLQSLADDLGARWASVVRDASSDVLADVMKFVCGHQSATEMTRGPRLTVFASAALGLVLDEPDRELGELCPLVHDWYRRTAASRATPS